MRYFNQIKLVVSGRRLASKAAIAVALTCLVGAGCAGPMKAGTARTGAAQAGPGAGDQWGIKIKSVRETAKGHMLDLRYEVTEPDRAAPVLHADAKPYLIHKRTGIALAVPNMAKVGPLQQTSNPPVTGVVYFMLFGNDGLVKPGDEVKLVIGDAVFEGLYVQ